MRTKALLLGAVIGAASLVTSMAQVYSVNIVGYVNVSIPNGFVIVANPLNASPDNTVASLMPTPPNPITIYKYRPSTGDFAIDGYDVDFGWDDPALVLNPGDGFFVFNGSAAFTQTFVGEVPTGTLTTTLGTGFNMIGSKVPQEGLLQTDLGYTPSATGDTIYKYRNATGDYGIHGYDPDFGWDEEPRIAVAEGFWAFRSSAGSWTRTFNVN